MKLLVTAACALLLAACGGGGGGGGDSGSPAPAPAPAPTPSAAAGNAQGIWGGTTGSNFNVTLAVTDTSETWGFYYLKFIQLHV